MSTRKERQVSALFGQSLLLKVSPLILLIIVFLKTTPFLANPLQAISYEDLLVTFMLSYVGLAYLVELGLTRPGKGEKGNFGVPLLGLLALSSFALAIVFYFDIYDYGSSREIDVMITLFFIISFILLTFQARSEIFARKKLKLALTGALKG